ncbi:hypothetical protein HPB50_017639 [Hyalomma asiaticum]|uniref:Uncharacterized protein n=1 Tax=Hyalomma asiaticum TaxID=266040 RepID=A0ACB7SRB0_HYAAI|nr:hypothetical protein HPB50_017639 [Hyalomma asiaticum]
MPPSQWPFHSEEGSFQSSVGREEHIGMAQSAVSNTYEVTEAVIISVAARAARRKLDEAKAAFALLGNIPGVLACVNGTLLAIRKPQGLGIGDTASILSRKGYYTLNVMVHLQRPVGKHRSMRSFVERDIGVLKNKFRCLQRVRTMLYSPEQCRSFMRALLSTALPRTRATGHWKSFAGECHQLSSQGTNRRWNRETCSSEEGSSAVLL